MRHNGASFLFFRYLDETSSIFTGEKGVFSIRDCPTGSRWPHRRHVLLNLNLARGNEPL